jgi:hypothetical protein
VVQECEIKRRADGKLLVLGKDNMPAIVALFDGLQDIR